MNQIKEPNELEQQKIALTKELERVQQEINYYNLDQIKYWNEEFKELINKRDRTRHKIEELKKEMEKAEKTSLSI